MLLYYQNGSIERWALSPYSGHPMENQADLDDGGLQWHAQIGCLEQVQQDDAERKKVIMGAFEIHKATKRRAKLRLGMSGPAGSGKTYSALLIASGLGGRIGMIDT